MLVKAVLYGLWGHKLICKIIVNALIVNFYHVRKFVDLIVSWPESLTMAYYPHETTGIF